jgi:2-keto-4-pentenoate hydratase/2-oxohepta-3-ene-1,7-dioic acid hydratase in catechol pathway
VDGETIRPLEGLSSLDDFVKLDPEARTAAQRRLGAPVALAESTLHAPLHPHKNVFCIGRNYLAHAEEGARVRGEELKLPKVPTLFSKAPTAIAGPGATLHLDGDASQQYDWEAELAVVIGTRCKDVREEDALGMIFGYTCLNDVSARDLQNATTQWFKGKTLDDTCPLGPWIVTADEIPDAHNLAMELRVNGEARQRSHSSKMSVKIPEILSHYSPMGYSAGDVVSTGTVSGVAAFSGDPKAWYLKPGDVMECEIEKIGVLRNPVISWEKAYGQKPAALATVKNL